MKVGILGLGLIGGSLARAYALEGHTVYAIQRNESMLSFAMLSGAVHGRLDETTIPECDLILLAIYPGGCADWLEKNAPLVSKDALVIDCCGTKRLVCDACFPLAKEYGFTYLGGHPMAGTHNSGFKYATPTMFHNAPMVLIPADHNDIDLLSRVKELLAPAGFGRFSITTAEQHDEMIAFTSQLAHVVSNAYIKSPTAGLHKGFSAGSYKDMTRVAWLAPEMWAELFLENKDFLMAELDTLMANLRQYQDAMVHNDLPGLVRLLDEGRKRKEEVDGR